MYRNCRATFATSLKVTRGLVAVVLLVSCGAPSTPTFQIGFSNQALIRGVATITIGLYQAPESCTVLRPANPRPTPRFGPYNFTLNSEIRDRGLKYASTDIPVGNYSVLADGLDSAGSTILGSACKDEQQVVDRQISTINLTLAPFP